MHGFCSTVPQGVLTKGFADDKSVSGVKIWPTEKMVSWKRGGLKIWTVGNRAGWKQGQLIAWVVENIICWKHSQSVENVVHDVSELQVIQACLPSWVWGPTPAISIANFSFFDCSLIFRNSCDNYLSCFSFFHHSIYVFSFLHVHQESLAFHWPTYYPPLTHFTFLCILAPLLVSFIFLIYNFMTFFDFPLDYSSLSHSTHKHIYRSKRFL